VRQFCNRYSTQFYCGKIIRHKTQKQTGIQFASASLIQKICDELQVSPADMFGGSNEEVITEIKKSRAMIMSMIANLKN